MSGSVVLLSGGLDSAVLAAMEIENGYDVWPVHVRAGLAWEEAEASAIARLLAVPPLAGRVRPLRTIALDMRDVYPVSHWAIAGAIPGYESPDEEVYLAGRNIVLTAKTAVLAAENRIERIALGPLAGNPFPDASQAFFSALSRAYGIGLGAALTIATPLAALHKADVICRGIALGVPLELTLSCLQPFDALHCGQCNKCRERRDAFRDAGVVDRTQYRAPAGPV
jgi:7-cyano-7-deazaguanine synthase